MSTIVTRAGKGSALTWTEADANFTNLNTDKEEKTVVALKASIDSPTFTGTPAAPTAIAGTNTTQLATTQFATTADNLKVNKSGDTMTGQLKGITPVAVEDLTRKDYVDSRTAGPAFHTVFSGTTVNAATATNLTNNTVTFDTTNSAMWPASGIFTPLVAGYYQINASVASGASQVTGLECRIVKNDITIVGHSSDGAGGTAVGYSQQAASALVYLNGSGDNIRVQAYSATGSFTGIGYFSGALIRVA